MDMVTVSPVATATSGGGDFDLEVDPKCQAFFDWLLMLADADRFVALFRWMREEKSLPISYVVELFGFDGDAGGVIMAQELLDGIARRCDAATGSFAPFVVDEDGIIWWIPGWAANDNKAPAA